MNRNDTFDEITRLANERLDIWRQAGKSAMTDAMRARLHQIEGQLPTLWDLLRREIAAGHKRATREAEISLADLAA